MDDRDKRRAPRLEAACRVEVDGRFGAFTAVTEDVGVRGCRIVAAVPPRLGTLLAITLRSELVEAPLRVAGQAVWARDGRVGISFAGPLAGGASPAAWVKQLGDALASGARAAPAPAPAAIVPPAPPARLEPSPARAPIPLGAGGEKPRPTPLARVRPGRVAG